MEDKALRGQNRLLTGAEIWDADPHMRTDFDEYTLKAFGIVAKAQDEISFKAGIKEVVEWIEINNRVTPQVNENRGANIPREVWEAKLEEWGIDG